MTYIQKPVPCKCGCQAVGPMWSARARGHIVSCGNSQCPAKSQAKTAADATEMWNRTATKF